MTEAFISIPGRRRSRKRAHPHGPDCESLAPDVLIVFHPLMGTRVPKNIVDYDRFGRDVGVRCLACHRVAVFDAAEVMRFFVARKIPATIPLNAGPFVCRCGSKALQTTAVEKCCRPEPLPPRRPTLQPLYVQEPRS
jgi:hypothetical protein